MGEKRLNRSGQPIFSAKLHRGSFTVPMEITNRTCYHEQLGTKCAHSYGPGVHRFVYILVLSTPPKFRIVLETRTNIENRVTGSRKTLSDHLRVDVSFLQKAESESASYFPN